MQKGSHTGILSYKSIILTTDSEYWGSTRKVKGFIFKSTFYHFSVNSLINHFALKFHTENDFLKYNFEKCFNEGLQQGDFWNILESEYGSKCLGIEDLDQNHTISENSYHWVYTYFWKQGLFTTLPYYRRQDNSLASMISLGDVFNFAKCLRQTYNHYKAYVLLSGKIAQPN